MKPLTIETHPKAERIYASQTPSSREEAPVDVTVDCLVAVLKLCLMKGAITLTLEDGSPVFEIQVKGVRAPASSS